MMTFLLFVPDLVLLALTALDADGAGLLFEGQAGNVFHGMTQDALVALMVVQRRDIRDTRRDAR